MAAAAGGEVKPNRLSAAGEGPQRQHRDLRPRNCRAHISGASAHAHPPATQSVSVVHVNESTW
jgi:hypothetical protein